jgi:hypothetical protein
MWAFRPCARLPKRPPSSPTRWCAWHDRWGSKATRISARRSGGDPTRRGQLSGPGALVAGYPRQGDLGGLYAEMVGGAIKNLEDTFAGIERRGPARCGRCDLDLRSGLHTWCRGQQRQCPQFHLPRLDGHGAVPHHPARRESTATDDLAWAGENDILIAITCKPYRREVVEAVEVAREQCLTVVGLSDSPASPIIRGADHGFVVAVDTPQFFPSSVSTIALLETLLSFVVAVSSDEIVDRVTRFHARRHELGIYTDE